MCPNICESTRDKINYENNYTDSTSGAEFFSKMKERNHFFYFFCITKSPASEEKIKIIIKKSNFIFIPVLEKLGSVDFVNQKNK